MVVISQAKERMVDFFINELKKDASSIRMMGVTKTEEGWSGRVEVTEDNLLLKKLGYPHVYDKHVYHVNLNDKLDLLSYNEEMEREEKEGKE